MFLRMRPAKGPPDVVGGDRSTTLCLMLDTVPELVALADVGSRICARLWFVTMTLVSFDTESFRMVCADCPPSASEKYGSAFSSFGESFSKGVGAKVEFVLEFSEVYPGTRNLFCLASSAASDREMAELFLRAVLNWNFFGGANSFRMF